MSNPPSPSKAGESDRRDFDFFDNLDGSWFDDFVAALGTYIAIRPENVSVRQAADAFHVTDEVIRRAAEQHYWLFVCGPEDDPTQQFIEMDGE